MSCSGINKSSGSRCTKPPKANGFCSSHQKAAQLLQLRERYFFYGQWFLVELVDILWAGLNEDNPLQPIKVASFRTQSPLLGAPLEWERGIVEEIFNLLLILLDPVEVSKKRRDIQQRAAYCASQIVKHNTHFFVTLDGHGRMILSVISELLKLGKHGEAALSRLRFVVPDREQRVTDFHQWLFPNQLFFTFLTTDIYKLETRFAYTFIYLNFCGIGGKSGIQACRNFLFKQLQALPDTPILLSWSVQRGATQYRRKFNSRFNLSGIGEVIRTDFITCSVTSVLQDAKPMKPTPTGPTPTGPTPATPALTFNGPIEEDIGICSLTQKIGRRRTTFTRRRPDYVWLCCAGHPGHQTRTKRCQSKNHC